MSSYEESQDSLRKAYEGEGPSIEIPKDAPEINPEIYRDIEPILFRGFLYVPAEINGVRFVFKSINHHEYDHLKLIAPIETGQRKSTRKMYAHFLAYGVYMVDGVNVLPDRERWIPDIVEAFEGFEEEVIVKIVRYLSEINRRANRAVALTEAFSLETLSRLRWAQLCRTDLTSTAVTGIRGTSDLGLNWGQLTWMAVNHYEDLKEQSEREWENAKFVASAMAGKGMSKVHSQDRRRRDKEREDRIERRDRIIRFALFGEPLDSSKRSAPVQVARTVEELASQLERDLKGEKDWHDLVVEAQEARERESRQQRAVHLQELQKDYESQYGDHSVIGGTNLQGLTEEEVRFRVTRHRQLVAQSLAAQTSPELAEKMAGFQEKWDLAQPVDAPLIPTSNRTPGVPFNRTSR